MKISSILIAAVTALISTQAFSAEDSNRTIAAVGAQGTGFVQVKEGFSQPCQFGTVYLPDLSQYSARAMMAVLIAAQSRGALISLTYDVNASGFCTASKIQAS